MSNRHLSRTIAMQTLFEWDFTDRTRDLSELIETNIKEFAPDFDDNGFTRRLVKGINNSFDEINDSIRKYAPEWPIDQITVTDRNVLRIGIYELKHSSEVPPKVAINEAIELAKTFGGESSGKFVNGVLGTIYKEMEESGEKISSSENVFAVSHEDSKVNKHTGRVEVSAGGVVFRQDGDKYLFALIKDGVMKWAFPKGHIEKGESFEIAALEEVKEETGLRDVACIAPLGTNVLTVNKPDGTSFKKPVHFFLIKTSDATLSPHPEAQKEVQEAKWFSPQEAYQAIGYADAKQLFKKALDVLGITINT